MIKIRLRLSPLVAVCLVVYIIGAIFAPTIAFACEGGGEEEPKILVKPASPYTFPQELVINNETGITKVTFTNDGPGGWIPPAYGFAEGKLKTMRVVPGNSCEEDETHGIEIPKDGTCKLEVEFKPKTVGEYSLIVIFGPGFEEKGKAKA